MKFQLEENRTDDEDGGPRVKSHAAIAKIIAQPQPTLQTSKPNPDIDDEDDDGGVRPKPKQERKAKSHPKEKSKKDDSKKKELYKTLEDSADEDGAMLKSKKKVKKQSLFFQCFDNPELNDHSHVRQKKLIKTDLTSEDEDSGSIGETSQVSVHSSSQETTTSATSTVSQSTRLEEMSNGSTNSTITIDSASTEPKTSFTNKIYFLRTKSYQEAQDSSPRIVLQRSNDFHSEQTRRNMARTRWHLAYTLIRNRRLCKQRKQYLEERRRRKEDKRQSVSSTDNIPSETLRTRRLK